jgi:protein associated with RNAse G/E
MTKSENTMTYYVQGKKLRADMDNIVGEGAEAKRVVSHMVNDGAFLYMWADGEKNGTKMAIPSEEETKQMAEDAKKYQAENPAAPKFESETDYNSLKDEGYTITCKSTTVDAALLTPPKDLTFIDPTEIMKKVTPTGSGAAIDMEKLQEMARQYGAGAADGE